jgi:hypothetical protein
MLASMEKLFECGVTDAAYTKFAFEYRTFPREFEAVFKLSLHRELRGQWVGGGRGVVFDEKNRGSK